MNNDTIKKFINQYASNINQNQFDFVYRKWLFEDVGPVKILTELFYRSGVNPLNYTSTVPIEYAKESDKVDNILIPSNIMQIDLEAFKDSSLRHITFSTPSRCTFIDHRAFSGTLLKKIVIPDGMKDIGVGAFKGCAELEEVSLPNTPGLKLFTGIFRDCPKLITAQYRGTAEEYKYNLFRTAWTIGSSLKYIKCSDGEIRL